MRKLGYGFLAGAAALVFALAGAEAQPSGGRASPDGTFFAAPRVNESAVDWCANFGRDCGQAGADAFCRSQGYSGAGKWERVLTDRTFNIGARKFCTQNNGCGALRDVVCLGGNANRGRRAEARGCGWRDANDPNAPAEDAGRGIRNATAHYDYALSAPRASLPRAVTNRLEALRGCTSVETFARFYGEASVMMARIGIDKAGWRNRQDSDAPADDAGRGVLNAQAHYEYASGRGAAEVPRTIGERLRVLDGRLSRAAYARLYADLSVMIANTAQGRR